MKRLGEDGDLDARGVPITAQLLQRLLRAAPTDPQGRPSLNSARFSQATFTDEVSFNGVVFNGQAQFDGAAFEEEAGFGGATFGDTAQFHGATFEGEVDFGRATFKDAVGFELRRPADRRNRPLVTAVP